MDNFNEEIMINEPPKTPKEPVRHYSNGFFSTLTFQVIICLVIIIGMVLLNTFYNSYYSSAEAYLKEEISNKASPEIAVIKGYIGKISASTASEADTVSSPASDSLPSDNASSLNESEPSGSDTPTEKSTSLAQGGEQNIVSDGEVPANAVMTSVNVTEKFILPLDAINVTSPFGIRRHPITNNTEFHYGVDLASGQNSSIYAAASGVVSEAGYSDGYGNFVWLTHKSGVKTFYAHCEALAVKEGEQVKQGDVIAYVGSTGVSTGYHLHFGAMINGVYFNPKYIINI